MTNNSFHLTQIIASAWSHPADITEAIWQAGYRKPERNAEEIATLTIEVMEGVPYQIKPKNLNNILTLELNDIIFDATWSDAVTPAAVAKIILENGYRKRVE
ncbi:hypothetical protein [Xenorhabdus lircayensis]|uniref:Phage protein n=1 Tax=Xenorhabdus lircayensis TaxID=2763499 RepID=A0ABS0U1S9_9GAMM|nr:hypothetical protein [Xenorhabdus lircayensis]MBI6547826.1 hypothetical protein [Xenorhabdus lircayensis]